MDRGLWMHDEGGLTSVAFPGMPVEGGLTMSIVPTSTQYRLNSAGEAVFLASIVDPVSNGGAQFEPVLMKRNLDGTNTVVIRGGDDAPGVPLDVTILTPAWGGVSLLNDGRVIFSALLQGQGVSASNNVAIYITRSGGEPELLLRGGGSLIVGGQLRTLTGITWLDDSGAEAGGRIASNELGQVAVRAEFLDGTRAIIVVSPDPACPGDANGDGAVNFTDLNIILGAYGNSGDIVPGDFNLDGDVDFNDLNQVLSNYGELCPQ
jgi:hypothetical protein